MAGHVEKLSSLSWCPSFLINAEKVLLKSGKLLVVSFVNALVVRRVSVLFISEDADILLSMQAVRADRALRFVSVMRIHRH